jgi:predicted nuclease with TOPRIM domain
MPITPEQFREILKETVNDELNPIKEKIDQNHDEVMGAVDGLAKKFDNFHAEMAANQAAHDRFEKNFADIKKRLSVLEQKAA